MELMQTLVDISHDYEPIFEEYQSISQNSEFTLYLANLNMNSLKFSFSELTKLKEYAEKTDAENFVNITSSIQGLFDTYQQIESDINAFAISVSEDVASYEPDSSFIEIQVKNLY